MSSNNALIILILLLISLVCVITFLLIYFIDKRKWDINNTNGLIFLEVDIEKQRIKYRSDIQNLYTQPFFLKKLSLWNKKWKKLESFLNLLDKKASFAFEKALETRKNIIIDFNKQKNKLSTSITKVIIELNFIDDNKLLLNLSWKEITKVEKTIIEGLNTNINYLINPENHYVACVLILNIKNINTFDGLIKIFKDLFMQQKIIGVKTILDWNKLFFVFPKNKFSLSKAHNIIRIIKNYYSYWYSSFFKSFYAFDSSLLLKKEDTYEAISNYELIFDYLKLDLNLENPWLSNNFLVSEDFSAFKNKYNSIKKYLQENAIDTKQIYLNDLEDSNKKLDILLIDKKFKNEFKNFDKQNKELWNSFDLYKNYFLSLYKNLNKQSFDNKILNIQDFIFNTIDNATINELNSNSKDFLSLIKINSKKTLARTKKKVEQIKDINKSFKAKIRLTQINESIILNIGSWIDMIWIDEEIVKKIDDPSITIFLKFLLKKAEELKISVVFEKMNYKNYKKTLSFNNLKLFYTKNKIDKKFASKK
ncbi:Hypothetical protein MAU_0900 [Metamycoplasma auris 15026]|uniref:Uncharacterized protein n=1 Tax=Metamycoplasma auris 15026 TaxID=1188233 RepID=N9VCG4_9BACT|nr:hypothetical protein [Metamycoplasma auris]ENY69378.1 Hypothetical protein MAU_0900 [Metamycoplasma auris 15026]